MKNIKFYFDFLSPYSYFAWLDHLKAVDGQKCTFTYHPVLMGKLFSHFKFPGPGEIIVKRNHELKKCFRYAAKRNIPFAPPQTFPFNPLAVLRSATRSASGDCQFETINCLFKQIWAEETVLDDPDLIKKILQANNLPEHILELAFEKAAKLELKKNIKDAITADIFGVPSFEFASEVFWGNDSLEYLNDSLEGNDNWNKDLYNSLIEK